MKSFLWISILVLLCAQAYADTLYVSDGNYPTIQSAIDASINGDTIIVAQGRYKENINFLGKAVTVRSVDPNDPNVKEATIIDGNEPNDPDYASVVIFNHGETNQSVLAGFTITGGSGSWLLVSWEYQGLRWNRCGGGVVCYNMSAPTISKNVFANNSAGQGGGIYIYGDPVNPNNPSNPSVHVKPIITDNIFTSNSAIVEHGFAPPDANYPNNDNGDGGAIVAFQGCDPILTGNYIENNHADLYGGGLHFRQWSHGLIENNHFLANDSALGAGLHITYTSSPDIRLNTIKYNTATALGGGGMYIFGRSQSLIERNLITQNESTGGAGIAVVSESVPIIRNNLIFDNIGSGIRCETGSTPKITLNTITKNTFGGIQCLPSSAPIVENNIITSNGNGCGIYLYPDSSITASYNNVWDNKAGNYNSNIPDQTGINGNISVSPRFINSDSNDFHLNYNSLCINAADANLADSGPEDFDGQPRIRGQFADIGALEAGPIWNISSGEQYDNIQSAIDDANDGQTIIVTIGTHTGPGNRDIKLFGKPITVRSLEPNTPAIAAATIIDCNGSDADKHRGFNLYQQEGPNSVLAGLTITNGFGMYQGGAIYCFNFSSPTIKNCIITNNFADGRGGGIYCGNGSGAKIINCIITNNTATRGYGGGVCFENAIDPVITNCIVTDNDAAGYHHGGGIHCWAGSGIIVANCTIAGNSAGHRGGGLCAYWTSPTFVNCTITGNKAEEGGGVNSYRDSNPSVINCIVRNNISPYGDQLSLINVWDSNNPTEMTVSFSNIQGGQAQAYVEHHCTLHWDANSNIDLDPNFANPGYWDDANTPAEPNDDYFVVGNYHIRPESPCVNAGDNTSVSPVSTTDIDGEQRIFGDTVDMGADEVVTNPFDLNNDGIIDYLELAVLADEWLLPGSELQTDFYVDNFIDLLDYAILAEQWLWRGRWYQ